MISIKDLKELFANSNASCVLYDLNFDEFFWEGPIYSIPEELGLDNVLCELCDATCETKEKYNVDYEICCNCIYHNLV